MSYTIPKPTMDDAKEQAQALRRRYPTWSAGSIGNEMLRRYGIRPVMPLLRKWLAELDHEDER